MTGVVSEKMAVIVVALLSYLIGEYGVIYTNIHFSQLAIERCSLPFGISSALCCSGVQTQRVEVDGVSTNVQVNCFERSEALRGLFWIINDLVYGLLQVPRVFTVCSQGICDLRKLLIPLALKEMNSSSFQCIKINYQSNSTLLGRQTNLTIESPLFACKQYFYKAMFTN